MPETPSNSVNSSQSSDAITRKAEVLHLLDSEINHILDNQKREGLTSWALLGGLAALIWLVYDKLESHSFTWTNVLIFFLVASVIQNAAGLLKALFWSTASEKGYSRFRYFEKANLVLLLIGISYIAGLIVIAWNVSTDVPWPQVTLVFLFLFLWVGLLGFGFACTYFRIPLAVSSGPPKGILGFVLFVLLLAVMFSATGYLNKAIHVPGNINWEDLRVASLLWGIGYLAGKLSLGAKDTPLISSLMEIRRDLVFGRMDLDAAIHQAEIVIAGIPVAEVLQENIRPYLKLLEEISTELHEALKESEAVTATLPAESAPLPPDKVALVKAVLESCTKHRKRMAERSPDMKAELDRIFKRVRWIGIRTIESSKAVDDVYNKIIAALKDQTKRIAEVDAKIAGLRKRLPA